MSAVFATTFVLSLLLPFVVKPLLRGLGIMDVPNERSSHERPVLRGLGLAVLIAIVAVEAAAVVVTLSIAPDSSSWKYLLVVMLGTLVGARTIEVPPGLVRRVLGLAWRMRAAPVPGSLFSALMHVPLLATERARNELGWQPEHTGAEALDSLLRGVPERAGAATPPLHP